MGKHDKRPRAWLKWIPGRGPADALGRVKCDSFWLNQPERHDAPA